MNCGKSATVNVIIPTNALTVSNTAFIISLYSPPHTFNHNKLNTVVTNHKGLDGYEA
jgi:hypothetical protein